MVEQDAVAGINAIGFAVVDRDPVGVHLGHRIRTSGVERGGFLLRSFLHQTVEFGRRGLVETGLLLQFQDADGLQNAQTTQGINVRRVFGALKADRHMGLGAQVVDFIGLRFLNDANQVAGVGEVAVVQLEIGVFYVRILVNVIDPLGVEGTGTAFDAVHDVAFFQEELGQIGSVLACDTGDERSFGGCGHVVLRVVIPDPGSSPGQALIRDPWIAGRSPQ